MEAFHVGMLLVTFAITFIALQVPSGILSDKLGRRIPVAVGLCLCVVSLAILPTVEAFPTLISVMVLYGTSYALIFPSISAMVADYTAPEERGRATGIFHALLTVGVAIGAPLMGWVAEAIGIKWGLALCSSAAILAIPIVLISLRLRPT
jgi:MFS family permease